MTCRGSGRTKKEAKRNAADKMLRNICLGAPRMPKSAIKMSSTSNVEKRVTFLEQPVSSTGKCYLHSCNLFVCNPLHRRSGRWGGGFPKYLVVSNGMFDTRQQTYSVFWTPNLHLTTSSPSLQLHCAHDVEQFTNRPTLMMTASWTFAQHLK